ncbi:hypothetical protein QYF36_022078 [Acer negundo]|nr:hypothetical protein QYF36_022078 [Acer negundo]
MDPEDIARRCALLSLTEKDGPVRILEESLRFEAIDRLSLCLVGNGTIESVQFLWADFWVQIHQVLILCMTKKIGWFLGGMIGEVLDVDDGNSEEAGGKFMRVRVRLEIDKPLKRCLRIDILGDGVESVMLLRYERLPNHCFKCGMIDHSMQECLSSEQIPVINGVVNPLFIIWMRASPPFNRHKYWEKGATSTGTTQPGSIVGGGN